MALAAIACGCHDDAPFPPYQVVDGFDDCRVGLTFAECGTDSTADPLLGCEAASERCWWFDGGAVPRSVTMVSACPSDDICCVNDWPFGPGGDAFGAYQLLFAVGTEPWDRQREMSLSVAVDPTLSSPASPTLTCTGALLGEPGVGPCDAVTGVVEYDLDTPAIAFGGAGNYYGWYPVIEIDHGASGELHARACIHRYTDAGQNVCPDAAATCAVSGSVTIDRWPLPATGAVIHLDATFADGSTLLGDGAVQYVEARPSVAP